MYPFLRMTTAMARARRLPPLAPFAAHVSAHRIRAVDIDPWGELNNGRALTLFDLGRLPLYVRTGMIAALRRSGWRITVAGSTVRYRRRLTAGDRVTMTTRLMGWDARFLYLEQGLWRGDDCAVHVLNRSALTTGRGIVPTADLAAAMGLPAQGPGLPDWVRAWAEAEALRPWPPEIRP
jgi:acyl-CoA thioesterase FadM